MDGQINGPFRKRFLDFLGEQPLAADFRQGPILHPVARCADDFDRNRFFLHAMRCRQQAAGQMGLEKSEFRAARANAQEWRLHGSWSVC